ncbi:UvrD-helicase domain-containing protein [Devosia neptuniae]|jgi:DNA helicase-2/ATP-dependent DNA helicase PcrA|uniref:ATP-dependent helicase n=1 Tax=Devosia TaxID=46913 RepID=UPI0022AF9C34|nr:UvrD-helicase domain-containing protein [Devosia neptuniae]MCZ4345798.1 UvrD-helicase domain-containing protein [Devosia neptuniae]|tara:strand:+ start:1771 stop:4113 length:2343 start_codon:yes stop_codon:yes gene_type:complete
MSGADHPLARPAAGAITSQFKSQQATYFVGLNEEQRHAVESTEGPLLVLAGAGTGKTRVLTTRIAHILLTSRARGHEILAVTFTNKAAREMKARIAGFVDPLPAIPWMGTFHSIGARILRIHAELVDLTSNFTILDTDDQIRVIKQLLEAENIDQKRWTAKAFAGMLDGWKNKGWLPEDVPEREALVFANGALPNLYRDYQQRLSTLNAVDFGDLLILNLKIFRKYPDVLAEYHRNFKYMLVDEYQDSNVAQYLWLRLLAQGKPAPEANICVVGDDDQSIYGWRGAEVDNILRFEKDFPGAKVIKLERNYRSTANILKAASSIIAFNEGRLGKTLQTDVAEKGEPVAITQVWDSEEEARAIGEEIEQYQRAGEPLNSVAILVRASFQMREFEERFITLGLNYRVIGGPRFYERKEIRDALAYLRLVAQPADDLAFERIINVPKRGIGDATLKMLMETTRLQDLPLLSATRLLLETEELKPKQRTTLRSLIGQFDDWAFRAQTLKPFEMVEQILEESGYTDMLSADKSVESEGRKENLKELSRAMEEFETLGGFLEHISLVMDRDSADAADAVTIMTLHGAKGLEFNTVFLPGWEEGTFPSQRTMDESGRAGLEEERRLAYVGITRGRKRVRISAAQNRRIHGLWQSAIPSRFLDELPADAVEVTDTGSSYGGYGYGGGGGAASRFNKTDPFESVYETPGWQRARAQQSSRKSAGPMTIDGDLVARSVDIGNDKSAFAFGERVFHLKFGYGAIAGIEGNKLTIDFEKAGRKKVLESFVTKG